MLALAVASGAHAADPEPVQSLEEVVVVAEKREINLQKASVAISAVDGERMAQSNVNQLNDLNGFVPGLTIAKNEGSERVISIRGVGYETAQAPNTQPGVAFHIDGVYISHVMSLNQDLLDVERVEVLRGPQGTVFGQASTGGAINVISKTPKLGEFSGEARASYGNYNYTKDSLSLNLPLGETLALRATGQYMGHDGYAKATYTPGGDYDLDDANRYGGRLALLWKPTDSFSANLSGQYFKADEHASAQKNAQDPDPDPRRVSQDYPGVFKMETRLLNLTLQQDLPGMVIKSTTAFQDMHKNQTGENDRLAYAQTGYYDHLIHWRDTSRTVTQEVTLSSDNDSALKWIAGGYFLRQHALQDILEYAGTDTNPVLTDLTSAPSSFPYNLKYQTNSPYQHTTAAVFAQGTYAVSDATRVIAGLRYSYDKSTAQPVNFFNLFGATQPRKATGKILTGKLGLEHDVTPASMLYATLSRGYKPAGLNFNQGAIMVPIDIKPEKVVTFELGSKNRFLDNRLQLNAAAYYTDYKDYQLLSDDPVPNAGGVVNVPKAKIWGAEFEGSYILGGGFRLDGNLTLLNGKFDGDFLVIDALAASQARAAGTALGYGGPYDPRTIALVAAAAQNVNGNRPPKMPSVAGSAALTYTHAVARGELTARLDGAYRGHYLYRAFNTDALDRVPSYVIWNAFLQYQPDGSPWTVSLSVQNLFDNDGVNSVFTDPYGSQTTSREYIAPRQGFVTLGYTF